MESAETCARLQGGGGQGKGGSWDGSRVSGIGDLVDRRLGYGAEPEKLVDYHRPLLGTAEDDAGCRVDTVCASAEVLFPRWAGLGIPLLLSLGE